MHVVQTHLNARSGLDTAMAELAASRPDLVLAFGAPSYFASPAVADALRAACPDAVIAGCSTAGEIAVDRVYDNSCIITGVHFDGTTVKAVSTIIAGMGDSSGAGARLAAALPHADLTAVLLFGTGVAINGSALVSGMQEGLPQGVSISGGLAADGGAFTRTWTLGPDGSADDQIVAVGLYGKRVEMGYGTYAGWIPFGPARKVTRAIDNVLFELDGERALDVYKLYLGNYARDLPGSGLLFPFEMLGAAHDSGGVFRTILGIDEEAGSLTLAGNIDSDGFLRLMHSTTEKLIDGAETAARSALEGSAQRGEGLAILVSCIGRKLAMGDRVDEEVEAVTDLLAPGTKVTGFYSNGEIAASTFHGDCRLHNQTMTITVLREH